MTVSPLPASLPPRGEHLILYDGVCGLCNRMNQFVLRRDAHAIFDFASLQSPTGQSFLQRFGASTESLTTLYVIANYRSESPVFLSKARAVSFVLTILGGRAAWLRVFWIFPDSLLDLGYNLIARNRYRIFGRSESCLMPTVEFRKRFIDL